MLDKLVNHEGDDHLTQQILELLFSGFVTVSNRLLHDHLQDKYKDKLDWEVERVPKNKCICRKGLWNARSSNIMQTQTVWRALSCIQRTKQASDSSI